ncbi:tetratricopeptide repeat protein [Zavarzinella formosa]|uniref:tetratricopeptide repeat protein n=1 Tax=Zavarzinella formosa TaxID=360055 RepID=UPI0003002930|nr:tetratricopeptide repeat protein [Zavarzinella formosa]
MRSFSILGFLMFGASLSLAGSPEWEKSVREAVKYPLCDVRVEIGVNSDGECQAGGEAEKPKLSAADLQKLMRQWRNEPAEFPKLEAIIDGLDKHSDTKLLDDYMSKGVELGPTYLRDHPNDTAAMIFLSELLDRNYQPDRAEKLLTEATKANPKDPAVWRTLGMRHFRRFAKLALGEELPRSSGLNTLTGLGDSSHHKKLQVGVIGSQKGSLSEAGQFLVRAGHGFDAAVELDPDNIESRIRRLHWNLFLSWAAVDDSDKQEDLPAQRILVGDTNTAIDLKIQINETASIRSVLVRHGIKLTDRTIEDSVRMAERSPDPLAAAYAVWVSHVTPPASTGETVEERRKKFGPLQAKLTRLRQSTDSAISRRADIASVFLAAMVFEDSAGAAKILAAMRLGADDDLQDNVAVFIAGAADDPDLANRFLERKVAAHPSARRSYLLAKGQIAAKRHDEAKKHLQAAVKRHPEDVRLAATLAALLIQEGTKAEMDEVGKLLAVVEQSFSQRLGVMAIKHGWELKEGSPNRSLPGEELLEPDDQQLLQITRVNRVLWLGLTGRPAEAAKVVREWNCHLRPWDRPVLDALELVDPAQRQQFLRSGDERPDQARRNEPEFEPALDVKIPLPLPALSPGVEPGKAPSSPKETVLQYPSKIGVRP